MAASGRPTTFTVDHVCAMMYGDSSGGSDLESDVEVRVICDVKIVTE